MLSFRLSVRAWEVTGSSLTEPRAAASLGHRRLEAMARMPLCTLAKALTKGKTTSEFNNHAGQERDTSGHLLFTESRWRGSPIHGKRLAWVIAQHPRTVFSSAVITKVFAANYKKVNKFLHWLIKLAMCTVQAGSIGLRHCNLCTGQWCACAWGFSCRARVSDKLCHARHVHRIVTVLVVEMKALM